METLGMVERQVAGESLPPHRAPPGGAGGRGGRVVASSSLIGLHEVTATDTPELTPRYERFTVTYPSGTVVMSLAHDEALTGILGALDLGEIPLVEQRELHLPRLDQSADGRGPQRRDPIQAFDRFDLLADPGFGDHAPVSHEHHAREA